MSVARRFRIGVVGVSRAPVTRWGSRGFTPSGLLAPAPATPPMTRLGPAGPVETWYLGPAELVLHPGETGHYRDNLATAAPRLWVALATGGAVAALTANPYEGEGLAGDPGLVVEGLAMPASIVTALGAFFAAHHVERAFEKRSRRRADSEALARGRR